MLTEGELAQRLNGDEAFRREARYLQGVIVIREGESRIAVGIDLGNAEPAHGDDPRAVVLSADPAGWDSVALHGGLHRAFRHGKVAIQGNRLLAMQYWKAITRLGDVIAETR